MHSIIKHVLLFFFQRHKNISLFRCLGIVRIQNIRTSLCKILVMHIIMVLWCPPQLSLQNDAPSSGCCHCWLILAQGCALLWRIALSWSRDYITISSKFENLQLFFRFILKEDLSINHPPCLKGNQMRFQSHSRVPLALGGCWTPAESKPLLPSFLCCTHHSTLTENVLSTKHKHRNPHFRLTGTLT